MNRRLGLLSFFIVLIISVATANDSCKILFNNRVLFNSVVDQEQAEIFLPGRVFKNRDCITIAYSSDNVSKGWRRSFYLDDANDHNIKTIESVKPKGVVFVKASVLNEMRKKKQPVFLYTMSIPIDKELAARVRVRRMFICKIGWN